jgi:hypothetical protein
MAEIRLSVSNQLNFCKEKYKKYQTNLRTEPKCMSRKFNSSDKSCQRKIKVMLIDYKVKKKYGSRSLSKRERH